VGTEGHEMEGAAFAPIERELLAQNLDRLCLPRPQVLRAKHRLPKCAEIASCWRTRTNCFKIRELQLVVVGSIVAPDFFAYAAMTLSGPVGFRVFNGRHSIMTVTVVIGNPAAN